MHDFLKTRNGEREIDLHPSLAKLLREFIGTRKSGLLFRTRTGQQLHQSNILRRVLHPILEGLGQPKCGVHAFRRFRNTYLRNYTSTPPGVYRFWMGHASGEPERTGETMSDRYDKAEHERALRKEWAERAGLGFELPRGFKPVHKRKLVQLRQQNCSFGPKGPKTELLALQEMAASL
jgi:integrase